ncbi:MAG: hypothetical protein WCT31_04280 [Candidatus Micrarchaeia archaeon]
MDFGKEFMKLIPFFLFLVLIGVLGYSFMVIPNSKSTSSISMNSKSLSTPAVSCENGQTKTCMSGSCQGSSECAGGHWTPCYVKKICMPGTNSSCGDASCANGYKICNECGNGYGVCTPK